MDHQHQAFRKRVNQKQRTDLEDGSLSGGIICDLNVTFNAFKLPMRDRNSQSKNAKNNTRQISSKIYEDLKKYLGKSLTGMSKQELADYVVKLLLKLPSDSSSDGIRSCHQDGSIANSLAEDTSPSLPRSNELTGKHMGGSSASGNRRCYKTKNNEKRMFAEEVMGNKTNTYQDETRRTQDQSYFNKIVSAIDLLCDMRALFDQTLIETVGTKRGESPQGTDRSCDRRFSVLRRPAGGLCKESATKCNKTVQTEAPPTHSTPADCMNFQHGHDCYNRENVDSNAVCREEQNSYNRFMDSTCYYPTPYPLTPPTVNLKTYKKYRPM